VDFLHRLIDDFTAKWSGWDTNYRLLAIGVGAVFAYLIIRAIPPLVRFLLVAALAIGVVSVLFPGAICSLPWVSTLQTVCPH
jgi:hypothetical protein